MLKFVQKTYKKYRHVRRVVLNVWHAQQARRRNNYPAKGMRLIGVTGTDGKTTTATMLANILQAADRKVGLISTVEAKINGQSIDTGLHVSTPGPTQTYELLARMKDEGVDDVVIEATSHGLDQRRLYGLVFDVGIITNIAPEHLDYHGTIEAYAHAKARLLQQSATAVLNTDDSRVASMNTFGIPQVTFGIHTKADVMANEINLRPNGVNFAVKMPNQENTLLIELAMPGEFNVSNALAAISAANLLGINQQSIQKGLKATSVAGRWQIVQEAPFHVIIDFAHTPQAFAQVLPVARLLVAKKGRLFHVFGSAAQRDEDKRSEMGRLSGELSDISILTMEDPRFESLDRIQGMLIDGLKKAGKKEGQGWQRIDDRQQAIDWAIAEARQGDVVIITGKGHEKSLSIKGIEHPWSDYQAAKESLQKKR